MPSSVHAARNLQLPAPERVALHPSRRVTPPSAPEEASRDLKADSEAASARAVVDHRDEVCTAVGAIFRCAQRGCPGMLGL